MNVILSKSKRNIFSRGIVLHRVLSDKQILTDVVLIGYGTARKSYMTDSFAIVSSKVFNKGLVSSPEQLINGRVSGVQIMSNSGSASAGSTIRVRGGASLNASNVLLSYSMVYHWN